MAVWSEEEGEGAKKDTVPFRRVITEDVGREERGGAQEDDEGEETDREGEEEEVEQTEVVSVLLDTAVPVTRRAGSGRFSSSLFSLSLSIVSLSVSVACAVAGPAAALGRGA